MSKSTGQTAAEYFGAMAEEYDTKIRRAVPRYDEMTEQLLAYLPEHPLRILELGCGTGNLTLRLAARFAGAQITAVDAAEEMTALTAQRAARAGPATAVRTITARFEELDLPAAAFDLVTSCMSLHHVRDKAPLYRQVRGWLGPGGAFCFADQLSGVTERIQRLHWGAWLEFCRRPGNCTDAELASFEEHAAKHDHYEPLRDHLRYFEEAGFVKADVVWRYRMYTVVVAEREEGRGDRG